MINKKGAGEIGVILLVIFFFVNYFIWGADWVSDVGNKMITDNSLTGIEAFLYSNLNFWIIMVVILSIVGWAYFSAE